MAIMPLLSLTDVILGLNASKKRDLLELLAAEAARRCGIPETEVLDALKAREKLGSTALGKGVAFPHAELEAITTPVMLFARLNHAIDFGAQDDEPVDLVFLVLWPAAAGRELLPVMADICRVLREPEILRELRHASTAEQVVSTMQDSDALAAVQRDSLQRE